MFTRFAGLGSAPARSADVVVVGSGPAGLPVAEGLLDAGASVIVVEAGSGFHPGDPNPLNQVDVTGLDLPSATRERLSVWGGTGQSWSGQCLPFEPLDFTNRDWVPQSGWAFGKQELEPWYRAAEDYFGVTGATYDLTVHRGAGIEPLGLDPKVFEDRNTVYSPKLRVGSETRDRFASDENARVILGATASRILVTPSGRAVAGVEIRGAHGDPQVITTEFVILACGAIENARLLLNSGEAGLGNHSAHLGRHFQEHPVTQAAVVTQPSAKLIETYRAIFQQGWRHRAKSALAPTAQVGDQVLEGTIELDFQYPEASSSAAIRRLDSARAQGRLSRRNLRDVALVLRDPVPVGRMVTQRARGRSVGGETPDRVLLRVLTEQDPASTSRVSLSGKRDALGIPVAAVDWTVSDAEWRTARVLTMHAKEQFADLGLGRVDAFDWLNTLDGFSAHVSDTYHHAGTTRMAVDPADGVVDPDCQVHGVEGLFVAGGSVFPTSGFANPTLTIVALSLRLAGRLAAARASRSEVTL